MLVIGTNHAFDIDPLRIYQDLSTDGHETFAAASHRDAYASIFG